MKINVTQELTKSNYSSNENAIVMHVHVYSTCKTSVITELQVPSTVVF